MLEERLPGVAARFRRHGETLSRMAHIGAAIAERIVALSVRRKGKYPDAAAYWRKLAQSVSSKLELSEAEKQIQRRGRRR